VKKALAALSSTAFISALREAKPYVAAAIIIAALIVTSLPNASANEAGPFGFAIMASGEDVSMTKTWETRKREALFIDPGISDIDTLVGHLRSEVEPILLDQIRPATQQMAQVIAQDRDLAAIHVIAHGSSGQVCFTSGDWSAEMLPDDVEHLAAIGRALAPDGELRLWSCKTGRSMAGRRFVAALAEGVGANVSAASSAVGAASLGGSWELDVPVGAIAPAPPLTPAGLIRYSGILPAAEITVTGRLPDGDPTGIVTYIIVDTARSAIVSQVVLPDAVRQNHSVSLTVRVPSGGSSYAIGTFDANGNFQPSSSLTVSNLAENQRPGGPIGSSGR